MDRTKQIDVMRQRNMNLSEQIKDLQLKLEYHQQLNTQGYQSAKQLIQELERIKDNWLATLNRLYDIEAEYQELLSDMKEIKGSMLSVLRHD